jgi:hypothetical protein
MYDFGLYFSVCQCASEPPNTLGLADFATRHTRQSTPQFHTHAPRLRLRVTHRGLRTRRVPRAGQRDRHTGTQGSGRRPCRRKRQSDSHTAHVSSRHSVSLTTRTARHGKHGHALLLSLRSTSHTPAQAQAVSSTAVCTHHTHRTESNAVRSILDTELTRSRSWSPSAPCTRGPFPNVLPFHFIDICSSASCRSSQPTASQGRQLRASYH